MKIREVWLFPLTRARRPETEIWQRLSTTWRWTGLMCSSGGPRSKVWPLSSSCAILAEASVDAVRTFAGADRRSEVFEGTRDAARRAVA